MELQVFKSLEEGNNVLKELHSVCIHIGMYEMLTFSLQQMTLNDVEKLMLDTEEALAYQRVRPLSKGFQLLTCDVGD